MEVAVEYNQSSVQPNFHVDDLSFDRSDDLTLGSGENLKPPTRVSSFGEQVLA